MQIYALSFITKRINIHLKISVFNCFKSIAVHLVMVYGIMSFINAEKRGILFRIISFFCKVYIIFAGNGSR